MAKSFELDARTSFERGYVLAFAIGAALISILPNLYGLLAAPSGSAYQGFQWAADDHYVYAAWMRQAMEGRLLMDNRFAIDPQPGLTIHLYFFVLGLIAKVSGIPIAMALGKMGFSALFIILSHRLIQLVTENTYLTKLGLALVTLGGGVGFLVWENFGPEFERPSLFANALQSLKVPGVPNDVWQPEAFVFPSMLTNGLFMVSLCLILGLFLCFLNAKDSWKPVLPGALCAGLLMNIHSYDVLLVALVMVGFLVMQIARRAISGAWILRAMVIASGAIPPALWFLHVLKNDTVFQERAATPTYSPNFKVLLFGYILMMILAAFAIFKTEVKQDRNRMIGMGLSALIIAALFFASPEPGFNGYFMSLPMWLVTFTVACAACALLSTNSLAVNLVIAWALVGSVAPYYPSLFERKLTMGLSVPWAILAAVGIGSVILDKDRSKRNLITVLTILVLGGTSLRWFFREIELAKLNVSNTTLHSVYLSRDAQTIIDFLNKAGAVKSRAVLVALPGVAQKDPDRVDEFREPILPDLNPVLSGLTGVYSYAGHWSETPNYIQRRNEATELFLARTSDERRAEILAKIKPNYIVAPDPNAFPDLADLTSLGDVVAGGNQFKLIRVRAVPAAIN